MATAEYIQGPGAKSCRVLGLDPGSSKTGWALLSRSYTGGLSVDGAGVTENDELLERLCGLSDRSYVVLEFPRKIGKTPVMNQVFDTAFWAGRFAQELERKGTRVIRAARIDVVAALRPLVDCSVKTNDARVRRAVMAQPISNKGALAGEGGHKYQAAGLALAFMAGKLKRRWDK